MEDHKERNLIVPDTNVLFNEPYSLGKFIVDGGNDVVTPLKVIQEVESKKTDPRLGPEAKIIIREIGKYSFGNNPNFKTERRFDFEGLDLDPTVPDYKIIATFNYILKSPEYAGYKKYKLVTDDLGMRIVAYTIFKDNPKVSIEAYKHNLVEIKTVDKGIPTISVDDFPGPFQLKADYDPDMFGKINQNAGIVIEYGEGKRNLFIRKSNELRMIKNDSSLFGLKAVNGDSQPNYGQLLAFDILSDPSIKCVILEGGAGTGKTLMALTAGLFQQKMYRNIFVSNPMVPLSGKSSMGYLPGDIDEKSFPWLLPFEQNLKFLESNPSTKMAGLVKKPKSVDKKDVKKSIEEVKLYKKYGINLQPLEYIRGQTICDSFIIIEEAQNLTPHEVKTIITRLGKGSKIVFCGDLGQIDIPYLSENSSGLAFILERMIGDSADARMVGSSRLERSVRSELVNYAVQVL